MAELTEDLVTKLVQAIQQAVQQGLTQMAGQVGQQISQAIDQLSAKVAQAQTQTTGATMVSGREELGDVGGTENIEADLAAFAGINRLNAKRTFDEYQDAGLESIKRNQRVIEQAQTQLQSNLSSINNVSLQLLQNAVENANVLGKKVAENVGKSGDVATDRIWNVDEQGYQVETIISAIKPTLESVVAKILADMATAPKTA
jgi:hypothetical protein